MCKKRSQSIEERSDVYELDGDLYVNGNLFVSGELCFKENLNMKNHKIYNVRDPEYPCDGVNKKYVDERIRYLHDIINSLRQ
jgi:hypothetical protein